MNMSLLYKNRENVKCPNYNGAESPNQNVASNWEGFSAHAEFVSSTSYVTISSDDVIWFRREFNINLLSNSETWSHQVLVDVWYIIKIKTNSN